MILRLRPQWPAEKLAEIYNEPHDHERYGMGHHLRVNLTIALAKPYAEVWEWDTVADLSCGNGVIAKALVPEELITLGDYAPGYPVTGPLEQTLEELIPVDGYVLSETLEHLDRPGSVLAQIRAKARYLVLTTPLEAWHDTNAEHYWAWNRTGVEELLAAADWEPEVFASLDSRVFSEPYLYGMWVCK